MNVLLLSVSIHYSIVVPIIVNAQGKSQLLTKIVMYLNVVPDDMSARLDSYNILL